MPKDKAGENDSVCIGSKALLEGCVCNALVLKSILDSFKDEQTSKHK